MADIKMSSMLKHARENNYAVGYFEAFNLESLLAVVDAGEKMKSPVIIGFQGGFLGNPKRMIPEKLTHYGALCAAVAKDAAVPVSTLLNEAASMDYTVSGIGAGFDTVMYQKPGEAIQDMIENTKYVAHIAHCMGVEVESEVGELPTAEVSDGSVSQGQNTDPDFAADYVEQTGVDALAVAIGNVHLLEGSKSRLDLDLLRTLASRIKVPLVLHGGTGVSDAEMKEAIRLGICKVNIGTALKRRYLQSVGSFYEKNLDQVNPHVLMGEGEMGKDMSVTSRKEMMDLVCEYIALFSGENKV